MKSYIKHLCVVVMLMGACVHAWSVTITLKAWDHSAGAYITYGTFEKGNAPGEGPQLYDSYWDAYYSIIAWAPGEQTDIAYPGTSGSDYYSEGYTWPKAVYNGEATTLYAVYYCQADDAGDYDYYYTTKPSLPIAADCETNPTVTAGSNSAVASTSATVTCASGISALGDCSITSYGFVYGTSTGPTTDDNMAQVGTTYTTTGTSFSKGLTGLSASTTYYVRPYATNGAGTSYGTQTSFTTLAQYTISYNNNGGSGTISNQTKDHGVAAVLNGGASFSKTGYELSRWDTNSGGTGSSYALGGSYTANANLSLYAIWTPQEYTITLNNQSATSAGSTSITVTFDASTNLTGAPAITVPTKTGYTFGGYYTETGGGGVQVIAANGNVNAAVTDDYEIYTDEDKKWSCASDVTLYAKWTANTITLTLSRNGATGTDGSAIILFDSIAARPSSITHATNTDDTYFLAGYYAEAEKTNKVLDASGNVVNSTVSGYTTSGKWTRATTPTTLYAKWTKTLYTVSFDMQSHGSAIDDQEVESGEKAIEPDKPVAEDWRFLGWYKEDTYTNKWDFDVNTVSANTTLYAKWEAVTYDDDTYKAWCDPDITISGDIHLTSVNGVYVQSTSSTSNLLTIRSTDLSGVTKLDIKYLDADDDDAEVTNSSSLFRLCNNGVSPANYNTADASQIDVSAANTCDLSYSIRYTPNEYGVVNHYKLQITMKRGTRSVKTVTHDLYGRSLPEEFVLAVKDNDNYWYALPNTIVDNARAITPIKISVDNTTTPTKALCASTDVVYKGDGRYAAGTNVYGIRFTDGVLKDAKYNHLQVSTTPGTNYVWLSYTGSSTCQDWMLTTTDFGAYTLKMPSSGNATKQMGIKGHNIGYFDSPDAGNVYILPIETTITENEALVTEWGKKSVILDVDAQSASSAQAHFGDRSSAEKVAAFGQTRTSVKNSASKYNYTLRFGTLDFSTHKDEVLYIDWLDAEDNVQSTSTITIPWIIATDGKMSSIDEDKNHWAAAEVHVLPGATLEANGGDFDYKTVAIKQLEIYPGATVKITKGDKDKGTLNPTTLVLRNGWTRAGSKEYDAARLFITDNGTLTKPTNTYSDWYIDFDQYYPIAVPWEVELGDNDGSILKYKNSSANAIIGATTGSVRLRYYDGESRATNGQTGVGSSANWKLYGGDDNDNVPSKLVPGKGYAMTAKRPTGKAFSIIRMPLTIPATTWTTNGEQGEVYSVRKDQVSVTAHAKLDGSTPEYAKGWNFIANPFMAIYQGDITHNVDDEYNVEYVNIPDVDFKEYEQKSVDIAKLKPSTAFLIQAKATGTLTFGTSNRKASAPSYRNETKPVVKQKAHIILSNDRTEDVMGILVSEKYTAEYEMNADLQKLLSDGNTLRTYMHYGDMDLAYVAINEELAKEWIPVVVRLPKDGEYTFSIHYASKVAEMEGINLIDYQTGMTTNLLFDNYTFTAEAGTLNGRFAINAIVGDHRVPTGADVTGGDVNGNEPVKFIWHDKVYILHNNVIYDSTGKRVNVINK